MYNGLISGVSLDGMAFFYQNPLEFNGKTKLYQGQVVRAAWFESLLPAQHLPDSCPPCPLRYALRTICLRQPLHRRPGRCGIDGAKASLKQETRYPWDGAVKIAVDPERQKIFTLAVRIPGWARNEPVPSDLYRFADASAAAPSLKVNGRAADIDLKKGYALIRRAWSKGDTVELDLPMPVRRVIAPSVRLRPTPAARSPARAAHLLRRRIDNGGTAISLVLPEKAAFAPGIPRRFPQGVVVLKGKRRPGRHFDSLTTPGPTAAPARCRFGLSRITGAESAESKPSRLT